MQLLELQKFPNTALPKVSIQTSNLAVQCIGMSCMLKLLGNYVRQQCVCVCQHV